MAWLVADYHPVSFFSLRPAHATASGGQTLLTPTAFALKMALLGITIQTAGLDEGRRRFPAIRDLRIAVELPQQITVLKSFAKIRRPVEFKDAKTRDAKIADLASKGQYPFQSTIAYRELVQFGAPVESPRDNLLRIACSTPAGDPPSWLADSLTGVNYLGKRGGFLQLMAPPYVIEADDAGTPPPGLTELTRDGAAFSLRGTLQMLDDCGDGMTFAHADIYDPKRIALGKERIFHHVVLPYELARSSRGYSLYRRIAAPESR